MLKESQHIDALFKWIRTITLLIVAVYIVWCCCLIRKMYSPSPLGKSGYSVETNHQNTRVKLEIALQPSR